REPRLHLGGARGARLGGQLVAGVWGQVEALLQRLGGGDRLLVLEFEVGEGLQVLLARALGGLDGLGVPLDLAERGAGLAAEPAELLRDRGLLRVGGAALGEQRVEGLLGGALAFGGFFELGAQATGPLPGLQQLLGGLVHGGLHFEQGGRGGGAAVCDVPAEHVAVPGDRDQVRVRADQRGGLAEVVHYGHAAQQAAQRGAHLLGDGDQVDDVLRVRRQRRPLGEAVVGRGAADDDGRAALVLGLQQPDGVDRGIGGGDRDGVGGQAERGGDGGLGALLDGQYRGDRAEQAGEPVGGGQQRPRAVLAVEAELKRFLAGGHRAALPLGVAFGCAQRGQGVLGGGHRL